MSDVHVSSTGQQVVLVEADVAQQVVLVEVETSQGPPGAQGPAGPQLPPPTPAQVGMAAFVRDYGAGPVWDESFVGFDDVKAERSTRITINATGVAAPAPFGNGTLLQISSAAGQLTSAELDAFGAGTMFLGRRANGTPAAPTGTKLGDNLVSFGGRGFDSSNGFAGGAAATMTLTATEDWSAAGHGAAINFATTPNGGAGLVTRWKVDQDGMLSPTAGNLYDLGAAAVPIRNGYFAGSLIVGVTHKFQIFEATGGGYTRINMDSVNPSFWTWDTAAHVLSWQGNSAAAPQFSISDTVATFSGAGAFNGNTISVGAPARVHIARDPGGTYGQVALDWQNLCAWRVTWATADLNWLVNGTPVFDIAATGNTHIYGTLRVDGVVSLGAVTVTGGVTASGLGSFGSLSVAGTSALGVTTVNGSITLTGPMTASGMVSASAFGVNVANGVTIFAAAGYSRITLDTLGPSASFLTYDTAAHTLTWTANGAAAPCWIIDAAGNMTNTGSITAGATGRIGLSSAPPNYGQVVLDATNVCAWRCDWNVSDKLSWLVQGSPKFTVDNTGFTYAYADLNAGKTHRVQIGDQGNGIGYLYLDTGDSDRFESDWTTHNLRWIVNNVPLATFFPSGNLSNIGTFTCGGNLFIAGGGHMAFATDNSSFSQWIIDNTTNTYVIYSMNTKKWYFVQNGRNVASIDSNGNMVLLGTLTQNTAPGLLDDHPDGLGLDPAELEAAAIEFAAGRDTKVGDPVARTFDA